MRRAMGRSFVGIAMIDETMDGSLDGRSCLEALAQIFEYLAGELSLEADARVRAHLAACGLCSSQLVLDRAYLRLLRSRSLLDKASPSLRRRIVQALFATEESRPLR